MGTSVTDKQLEAALPGARLLCGPNLYFCAGARGKTWRLRFSRPTGGVTEISIGEPYPEMDLKAARAEAKRLMSLVAGGIDPSESKRQAKPPSVVVDTTPAPPVEGQAQTLKAFTTEYLALKKHEWKGSSRRDAIERSVRSYFADLNDIPIDQITFEMVRAAIKPVWGTKHQAAVAAVGHLRQVFDWLEACEYVEINPVKIKKLTAQLGKRPIETGHYDSMPWEKVPELYYVMRRAFDRSALAKPLAFCLLTAARGAEVRGMTWGMVSMDKALWTCPPALMKGAKEHRVPLSTAAMEILSMVRPKQVKADMLVFPSPTTGKMLAGGSLFQCLHEVLGYRQMSVHGMRSSFRVWAAVKGYPDNHAETAIAHSVGNAVTRAYLRTDFLDERALMMQAWADHVLAMWRIATKPPVEEMA